MKYHTIIWDWNGTLLDDVELAIVVMNRLLVEHGHSELSKDKYTRVFDFPVRHYYERIGFDLQAHDFQQLSDRFCADFEGGLHEADLFPEASAVLSGLHRQQHFVLSNTEQSTLERMLRRFELAHVFHGIYGLSDNHAGGKADVGAELIRNHAIDCAGALMIGDTTHDAEVAAALGIHCLLLSTGHHAHHRLADVGVPVAHSLGEVANFVGR